MQGLNHMIDICLIVFFFKILLLLFKKKLIDFDWLVDHPVD